MSKKRAIAMKRIFTCLLLFCLLAGCGAQEPPTVPSTEPALPTATETEATAATEATQLPTEPPTEPPTQPPTEPPVDRIYRCSRDGYQLLLPGEYRVDESISQVVTSFHSEDTVIEIYRQPLTDISAYSYVTYSNTFLENTTDHILDLNELRTYQDREYRMIAWHREKLDRLDSDKNHYLSMDTTLSDRQYTVFVKSSQKIEQPEDYYWILDTLEFFPPEEAASTWTGSGVTQNWNQETMDFYQTYFSKTADLSWGIFEYNGAYGDCRTIQGYEEALGYEFPIVLTYLGFTKASYARLEQLLEYTWDAGKVLELTFQTTATEDGGNMMYDILQGEYDSVLRHYADIIHDFDHPVLMRLMNEMNGDWCAYSAYHTSKDTAIYRAVYRYIWDIFAYAGVDNAIWIWNPNESSFPDFTWNHSLMYYPGDQYVDVIGLTAYNTGTYYSYVGEHWQSFPELYQDLYETYASTFSQPLMITEFSCAAMGGDKAQWTREMLETIADYDRIKVAVWWDHVDYDPATGGIARDYRIAEVLDVFHEYFKQ